MRGIVLITTFLCFGALPGLCASDKSRLENELKLLRSLKQEYLTLSKAVDELESRYYDAASICEGRLTAQTNVGVPVSDPGTVSTIYFTPYRGEKVALYTGSIWKIFTLAQVSYALSGLTSGKNYDVFLYDNSSTLTLELSSAWTSDTARNDAIVMQDGIWVKSGTPTRRYVGTIRATSATQTVDSATQRFVWSECHRTRRFLYTSDSTDSWTYATDSWRVANASGAGNRTEFVLGLNESPVFAKSMATITNGTGALNHYSSGVGLDSTSTNSAKAHGTGSANGFINQSWAEYIGYAGIGYHTVYWLERGHTSTITVYGDNADNTLKQSGMLVEIEG